MEHPWLFHDLATWNMKGCDSCTTPRQTFFTELVADCVAANADNPEYRFERAEFERIMLENFGNFKNNDDFYYSPVSTPSPRPSSPPTLDDN